MEKEHNLIIISTQNVIESIQLFIELHHKGILHRDIKPSNIIFSRKQSWTFHALLIDFDQHSYIGEDEKGFHRTTKFASINVHNEGIYTQVLPWCSIIKQYAGDDKRKYVKAQKEIFESWIKKKVKILTSFILYILDIQWK